MWNLAQQKKKLTNPNEYKQEFIEIKCLNKINLPHHNTIYTDGSKTEKGVSEAVVF